MGTVGSLGPGFPPRTLIIEIRVKPAFALALYGGFLTPLSRPLGALDIFSRAWRPTQTAHLSLSPFGLVAQRRKGGVPLAPPRPLARPLRRLPPTLHIPHRTTTTGCSKAPRGLCFLPGGTGLCASNADFAGLRAGTVGLSLVHSCKPPIKRLGITLP